MMSIRCQTYLVLPLVISVATATMYFQKTRQPVRPSAAFELKVADTNPDKFYLNATSGLLSYAFTYDPHEADAWMFRTAEGSMVKVSQISLSGTNYVHDRR
jgi:hypothetical protein